MADDLLLQLAQQQSMIAAAASGNGQKPSALLACIGVVNGSVDVGIGLTPKGKGLNSDKTFNAFSQRRNGPISGLLAQMNLNGASILDDLKKVAQGGNVMYSGSMPAGTPVSSGLPTSGGQGNLLS